MILVDEMLNCKKHVFVLISDTSCRSSTLLVSKGGLRVKSRSDEADSDILGGIKLLDPDV